MSDVPVFGLLLAAVAIAVTLAVLSNRVSEKLRVPAPAIFLLAAALASDLAPELYRLPTATMQRIVTVALAVILFDGGMHLGRARLRGNLAAVAWIGVAGTLLTALALAALAHLLFAFPWRAALLLGTALAPTDPAVVFSVLGRREIAGRTGTLLEGESGANDPVGIALMAALLAATGHGGAQALGTGAADFAAQMLIGAAVGVGGGLGLLAFIRRVPLPAAGLYPLRTLAGALGLYGVAAAAHGSGFLAVFLAGIVLGDATAPYHRDIKTFHSALASLGEITAFAVLGLTLHLRTITAGTLAIGLALAALLAFAVRPLLLGALLAPIRLRRGERAFVLWAGLKGAVPILLGTYILQSAVPDAARIFQVIFIVVGFSVIVQGGLVPAMATWLRVPARTIDPEPFSLGVRLRHQPEGVRRYLVAPGSAADQASVDRLALEHGLWISILIRDGRAVPLTGESTLQPGDEVLVQTDQEHDPEPLFARTAPAPRP